MVRIMPSANSSKYNSTGYGTMARVSYRRPRIYVSVLQVGTVYCTAVACFTRKVDVVAKFSSPRKPSLSPSAATSSSVQVRASY
ncbi:hypothetical protein BDN72DRAFT_650871 [Pluteus cervinus]|uniref:Uncharacterized protein n=1 Tax=Pluteus cervinus TaxID=181527 RepID=A0ACD3AT45_9AGAR|nr:hypothetical protein BDN72DRAFT_650871 [Pluteus cervinus]